MTQVECNDAELVAQFGSQVPHNPGGAWRPAGPRGMSRVGLIADHYRPRLHQNTPSKQVGGSRTRSIKIGTGMVNHGWQSAAPQETNQGSADPWFESMPIPHSPCTKPPA